MLLPCISIRVIRAKTLNSDRDVVAWDNPDHMFNRGKKDSNVGILSYRRAFK